MSTHSPTREEKIRFWKIVFSVALLLFGGLGVWFYLSYKAMYTVRTSANARPDEVKFLRLPASASRIGYWRDGVAYWAEFNIPEDAFRSSFSEFQFQDIAQPIRVHPKTFGVPEVLPYEFRIAPVMVSTGLHYQERWNNGGGYNIIYDRAASRAYYDFVKY